MKPLNQQSEDQRSGTNEGTNKYLSRVMGRGRGTHMEALPQHGWWRQRLTDGVLGAPWHFLSWNRKWKQHHQDNRGDR